MFGCQDVLISFGLSECNCFTWFISELGFLSDVFESIQLVRGFITVGKCGQFSVKMAQINGYKEELQDELQKTDPNSHASRLLAQGKCHFMQVHVKYSIFFVCRRSVFLAAMFL